MELKLPRELETRLERVAEQRGIALDVLALEALDARLIATNGSSVKLKKGRLQSTKDAC